MSSVEGLREFVNERLNAAAEEIFGVFKQAIIQYEEEIDRQRRLLDIIWKPEIKLHRIEVPQQHGCEDKEVLTEQQFCGQEEPVPPEVKQEQEEFCAGQDGKELVLQQETDTFMRAASGEESDHGEDQTPFNPNKTHSAAEKDPAVNIPVITSVVSAAHSAQSQAQGGDKRTRSTRNAEPKNRRQKSGSHKNKVNKASGSKLHHDVHTGKKPFKCDTCGKVFKSTFQLSTHTMRIHTGERPYPCDTCGKRFYDIYSVKYHMIVHTGERPHSCEVCGRAFSRLTDMRRHMRIHTEEMPCTCNTCGRKFRDSDKLTRHMRVHTGEKPHSCETCGKKYFTKSNLNKHARLHTGK